MSFSQAADASKTGSDADGYSATTEQSLAIL